MNKERKKGWVVKTEEDIEKLSKMFGGSYSKDPAKAIAKLEQDAHIDDLAALIEKKGSTMHATIKKSRKVWAMVDSGSFVTIANCSKAFGSRCKVVPTTASRAGVKYSNASGGDIVNRGETIVFHHLPDGTTLNIPFQDADVQCPIISVKDFVKVGSSIRFKDEGGRIKLPDGRILPFQERHGVYFILLDLGEDDDDDDLPNLVDEDDSLLCGLCSNGLSGFHRPVP